MVHVLLFGIWAQMPQDMLILYGPTVYNSLVISCRELMVYFHESYKSHC
jgi:hypothetical protein